MLVTDVGDEASANRKAMVFMGGLLPGNVLYWAQKCGIHGIVKCIFRVIKDRDVTGRLYSMHKIMQLGSKQALLMNALAMYVDKMDYYYDVPVPAANTTERMHSWRVIEKLLWRRRVKDHPGHLFSTKDDAEVEVVMRKCWSLLHGPWWGKKIVHYCHAQCPCGGSRQKAVAAIVQLMSWLLVFSIPAPPSLARWTTLGPSLAWLSLGVLMYNALPEMFRRNRSALLKENDIWGEVPHQKKKAYLTTRCFLAAEYAPQWPSWMIGIS